MMDILILVAIYYIISFAISAYKNVEVNNDYIDVYFDVEPDSQENKYTKYFIYKNLMK